MVQIVLFQVDKTQTTRSARCWRVAQDMKLDKTGTASLAVSPLRSSISQGIGLAGTTVFRGGRLAP
jgi:hypothetical protein